MKKILLLATIFLGSFFVASAQEDQPVDENVAMKNEKVQALYVAYVTKELNLTSEEAQKFWPVHNQFENEMRAVKKDLPELDREQAKLNIKKKYQSNFTSILGPQRFERFVRMRGAFQKRLIERLRKHRQNQGGGVRQGATRRGAGQ
jgi:Skp family chaperone for outer membrane proteins